MAAGDMVDGARRAWRQEKVSEKVAREILDTIVSEDLPLGASLPSEAAMLDQFGVGRASLREALRLLETQGIIRIKPGPKGGPVVQGSTSEDFGRVATLHFQYARATFRELVEARLTMEPMMAAVAASKRDPDMVARLRAVVDREVTDEPAYRDVTDSFHELVAGMSGNRVLDLLGRSLRDVYVMRLRELAHPPDEREYVLEAHSAIADAIEEGDADRAGQLMREHMEAFAERVAERFPGMLDELIAWS